MLAESLLESSASLAIVSLFARVVATRDLVDDTALWGVLSAGGLDHLSELCLGG